MTEFCWVLEKGAATAPRYATVDTGMLDWTDPGDHANALRLARREDAEALATIMEDADRVAQHGWDDMPQSDDDCREAIAPGDHRYYAPATAATDQEFQETTIVEAMADTEGWSIKRADGWHFYVPKSSPVVPSPGMAARFYGRGIGHRVRGLFLSGHEVFYRTAAQDKEHFEAELYGADGADWLRRWDEGQGVWSISMGGIGPGYEQAIQITAAEVLRHLLERKYDPAAWDGDEVWSRDLKEIETAGFANERIKAMRLSGAQWGAAVSLATRLYRLGPRAVMADDRVKDRHIQVSRQFPQAA